MNMESFKKEKTLFKVMGSSTGFLFVAILATFVGFSISSNLSLSDFYDSSIVGIIYEKIKIIFAFNLLLWPYFYCRQALLERRNVDPSNKFDDWAVTVGLQPSILLQLYSIAITLLILFQPQGIYPFGNWQAVFGGMLISLIPFFLLIVLSIWDLSRSGDNNEFRFVEKVLYPALATGIIPFSFGSSMAGKTFALTGIVIAVAYLVLLILINYFAKNEFTLVIPFLSFSLLLLIKEVWDVQILSSIVYGTLITSAMGVAEAAKGSILYRRKTC